MDGSIDTKGGTMTIEVRQIDTLCPYCNKIKLEARRIDGVGTPDYHCSSCKSDYFAEVFHDFNKNKHYWLGKRKNPEYWNLNNKTLSEGIQIFKDRDKKEIMPYTGTYIIEEIRK